MMTSKQRYQLEDILKWAVVSVFFPVAVHIAMGICDIWDEIGSC